MHLRSFSLLGLVFLIMAAVYPAVTAATSHQVAGNEYQSPQYDYAVSWGGEWAARERDSSSVRRGADTLVLATNAGRLQVIGQPADVSAANRLMDTLTRLTEHASQVVITAHDTGAVVPTSIFQADNTAYAVEVHDLDNVQVTVILSGRVARFAEAQDLATTVTLNGTPLFTGEPVPTAVAGDDTEVAATEQPVNETDDEPTAAASSTGQTGLDGSTFTSPGFGISLDIPDGWQVQSETIAPNDETLKLFNGTSMISIRASSTLPTDPADCVNAVKAEAAATPLHADLKLALTGSGELFQGADDRGAYALFIYPGGDGAEWTYFVRCEPLVERESVLVIVQDVPSEHYIAERQARRLIQISIERP